MIFGLSGLPDLIPSDEENLAGQSDEQVGREHLSASAVSTLLACPQKYGFSYEDKIEPVDKPSPLTMGGAFQRAIELNDPEAGFEDVMNARVTREQEDYDKLLIDATVVRAAATLYLATYEPAGDSTKEFEYRVRLRNPFTGRYSNTFDLLGFADEFGEEDGGAVLIENKLVGQISSLSVRRLPLDRQIALACYGIWRATGREVKKVRYRFTRKPSIRQKKDESPNSFIARLEADYQARPDFYLQEEVWYRSTEDLARIEAELWEWAEQVRALRKRELWPRNTSHCHDYGGCSFLPICLGDSDAGALYQEKTPREVEEAA
jgi:hypothetical protein